MLRGEVRVIPLHPTSVLISENLDTNARNNIRIWLIAVPPGLDFWQSVREEQKREDNHPLDVFCTFFLAQNNLIPVLFPIICSLDTIAVAV